MIPCGCEPARLLHCLLEVHLHEEHSSEIKHRKDEEEKQWRNQGEFDHGLALQRFEPVNSICQGRNLASPVCFGLVNHLHGSLRSSSSRTVLSKDVCAVVSTNLQLLDLLLKLYQDMQSYINCQAP